MTRFTVTPGLWSPSSPALAVTNLRHVAPPAGPFKDDILDQMTGTYTPVQISRMAQTYFDLIDSGIMDRLDCLIIRGKTLVDSLVNWVPGKPAVVNNGATLDALGLTADGTSQWVDLGDTGGGNFSLTSASMFARVEAVTAGANVPILGSVGSAATARLYINTNATVGARLNATRAIGGPATDPTGMWAVTRLNDTLSIRNKDGAIATETIAPTTASSDIALFRWSDVYGAQTISAAGFGANLTVNLVTRLDQILENHLRAI